MLQQLAREHIHSTPAMAQAPLSFFWAAHLIALKESLNLSPKKNKTNALCLEALDRKKFFVLHKVVTSIDLYILCIIL